MHAGGLTEQSWREGLAELSTLLARSRAQWKIVIGACLTGLTKDKCGIEVSFLILI